MTTVSWNRDPPPGFQGLRDDLPVTFYYRHLPHWRQHGATYFATFRLADSLPQTKLHELKQLKREFAGRHGISGDDWQAQLREKGAAIPRKAWNDLSYEQMKRIEHWLDQGMGECLLKDSRSLEIAVEALHRYDGSTYELGCYVIMPNHVHAVIRPLQPKSDPLEKVLQGRKQRIARQINIRMGRSERLWQDESFDRIIRDEEHLYRCIQYIGNNPRRAKLHAGEYCLWIRPEWEALGWGFEG
jgi:REP element-mobilizing transposase RayT